MPRSVNDTIKYINAHVHSNERDTMVQCNWASRKKNTYYLSVASHCMAKRIDYCNMKRLTKQKVSLIVGEPKSRIVQKHTFFAPER